MQSSMLKAIVEDFGNGGTIDGDLVVSGDLTVSGGGSLSFDEIIEGTQVIDVTNTEALLVRKNGDGGDVFTVDTTNEDVAIGGTLAVVTTTNSDVTVANFQSAIDANGEHSIIRVGNSGKGAHMGLLLNSSDTAYFGIDDNPDDGNGIYVNESASVGIGTKNPNVKNHIFGGSASQENILLKVQSNAVTNDGSLSTSILLANSTGLDSTHGAKIQAIRTGSGTDDLVFHTFNSSLTEAMRIDSSQNIAITNGKPFSWGTAGALNSAIVGNSSTNVLVFYTSGAEKARLDSSGRLGIGTSNPSDYHSLADDLVIATSGDTGISIVSGSSSDGRIFFADGTSSGDESRGHIRYDHSDNSMHFVTNDAGSALTIDSSQSATFSGNLALSASSPQINFSGTAGDYGTFGYTEGDPDVFKWGLFQNSGQLASITIDAVSEASPSARFRFNVGGDTDSAIVIDSSKRVGIGTDSPGTVLSISHSTPKITLTDSDVSTSVSLDGSGGIVKLASHTGQTVRFLIGSTERMRIDDNSRISLSNNDGGTQDNTIFGYQAGANLASGGSYNTLLGHDAGNDLTTGQSNVLIGYRAGDNFDTNGGNVAVGTQAMGGSADASNCVAIGTDALKGALGSGANATVAVGRNALQSLTSGAGNVAVGFDALQGHTTGARNTVVGYQAMDGTSGTTVFDSNDNTFMGYHAGGGTWTTAVCQYNVGIGNYSLDGAMNGANLNTAVGYGSLGAVVSGDRNVAIGADAGNTLTTGFDNVCIGRDSNVSANDAQNRIAIGKDAVSSTDNTAVIGNSSVTDVYMAQDSGATVHCAGIQFPASQVANGGANVLDDYEEGSGSPTVSLTGSGSVTLGTSAGNAWTKVGNIVHFQFEFSITGVSSPVGALTIALPFTSAGTYYSAGSLRVHSETFDGSPFVAINPNSSVAQLKCSKTGSATTDITPTAGTRYFFGQITYRAA